MAAHNDSEIKDSNIMSVQKDFVFSQQDLLTSSFSVMYDMKEKELLSDVKIKVGDLSVSAHRIILAAGIPYFRAMFTSSMVESKANEITIKDLDPAAVESLIDFVYTNRIKITTANAQPLLVASQFLQMTQVRDSCCDYLSKMLHPSNVMGIRTLSDSLGCSGLVEICDSFIRKNFDAFCETNDFLSLSFSFINELIRRDDLHVATEEKMFEAVIHWVMNASEVRHTMLPELLTGIRLTRLSPQFLIKKASKEKLILESFPCRDLLDEAKHFYMLPEEMPSLTFSVEARRYGIQPGIYVLGYRKCSSLTVLKYSFRTEEWDTLLVDKMRRNVKQAFALDGNIFVLNRDYSFEMLNLQTLKWSSCARPPFSSRPFEQAVSYNNRIYWFSSWNGRSDCVACVYDPKHTDWSEAAQVVHFSEADIYSSQSGICIFGYLPFRNHDGRIYRFYKPDTKKNHEISGFPDRSEFGCAAVEDELYICGGHHRGCTGLLRSVDAYNISRGTWTPDSSSMHTARKNFSLIPHDKKLYAIGGFLESGKLTNSVEYYDLATREWISTSSLPGQYDWVKAVVIPAVGSKGL